MNFVVIVPESIRDEIASWGLSFEVVDTFYERLQADLEYGHEHTCFRLAAPTPTYIYRIDIPDPLAPWTEHRFTVYLTYGERADALYVMQCDYEARDDLAGEQGEASSEDEG